MSTNQGSLILPVTRSLPGATGVIPGNTATIAFPIGPTYHRAWINYTNATLAQLTELRLVANGEVIRRYAASDLDSINQYDKRQAAGGMLFLDFERRLLLTRQGREITAVGTGGDGKTVLPTDIQNMVLEIDIDAAAPATTTLSAKVQISGPSATGLILKNRRYIYNPTQAGDFQIADIPKLGIYNRLFFMSANVSELKIERNNQVVFDRTSTENTRIQTDGTIRVPQAGFYAYDLTEEGYAGNGLDPTGIADLRFTATMSAAGSLPVIVESLEEPTPYTA